MNQELNELEVREYTLTHALDVLLPRRRSYASLTFSIKDEVEKLELFSYTASFTDRVVGSRWMSLYREALYQGKQYQGENFVERFKSMELTVEPWVYETMVSNLLEIASVVLEHAGVVQSYSVSFDRATFGGKQISCSLRFNDHDSVTIKQQVTFWGTWDTAYSKLCEKVEDYLEDRFTSKDE